ncbi:toxin-activating lysine-acyltransferase [Brucella intermedia]|uniref:toxin-activating lysine-acyltransferase n=1 Tax=Brucella intermedia TaxID=94625 RepID=UPI0023613395|nr:toxin-activating lysine-acyltransferase [Brucella intermedia]
MTHLALQSPLHRGWNIADIETNFLPPLQYGQCKIYFYETGLPRAFITWALLDDDTHNQLQIDGITPPPEKWVSGKHVWFIDLIAPHGDALRVVRDIQRNHFPGIQCHSIRRNLDGSIRRRSDWRNIVLSIP